MGTKAAARTTGRTTKPRARVRFIPQAIPELVAMSSEQLVAHGEQGQAQAQAAGLELLRRKQKALMRKAAA